MTKTKNKLLFISLSILFLVNAAQGFFADLTYDESYYWVFSKFLSFGYFDHPPMAAWWIKLGALLGDHSFGVRFVFNIASVLSLYLAWLMTNREKVTSFVLLGFSFILVQSAGFLALPDTPLLFFSALFLYLVQKYIKEDTLKNTLLLAITIAGLFYSKYHGLLVVLLTVMAYPAFLKRKSFWAVVVLTCLLYFPHMLWQYEHDFISFRFHLFGRVEKHFDVNNIINYLSSQVALFGFAHFFIFLYGMTKVDWKNPWERILSFNILGFLVLLFFASFRNQIEANWTITACFSAIVLLSILTQTGRISRKLIFYSSLFPILLILSLRVIFVLPDSFYEGKEIGRLNEVKGWAQRIDKVRSLTLGKPILSETYQYGAKLSFWLGEIIPVKHFRGRISHYKILNLSKKIPMDQEIYYVTPRKVEGAVKIETGYKDPIYIFPTTLGDLYERYGDQNEKDF